MKAKTHPYGYLPRCMVLTTLPHSRPPVGPYIRVNGHMTVRMATTSPLGIPYGKYARRLLLAITTDAVSRKSRTINLGDSLNSLLKYMGIGTSGGKTGPREHFKNQAERLLSTCITIEEPLEGGRARLNNAFPVDEAILWWNPEDASGVDEWGAQATLNEGFYRHLIEAPIPVHFETYMRLSRWSLACDLYVWGSYRRSKALKASLIPWRSIAMQFGANYQNGSQGMKNFKKKFREALSRVSELDEVAGRCLLIRKKGLLVKPGPPHVSGAISVGNPVDLVSYPRISGTRKLNVPAHKRYPICA